MRGPRSTTSKRENMGPREKAEYFQKWLEHGIGHPFVPAADKAKAAELISLLGEWGDFLQQQSRNHNVKQSSSGKVHLPGVPESRGGGSV